MRKLIRKLEKKVLRPFDFFANFTYYFGQPGYDLRLAWKMAGKTLPD